MCWAQKHLYSAGCHTQKSPCCWITAHGCYKKASPCWEILKQGRKVLCLSTEKIYIWNDSYDYTFETAFREGNRVHLGVSAWNSMRNGKLLIQEPKYLNGKKKNTIRRCLFHFIKSFIASRMEGNCHYCVSEVVLIVQQAHIQTERKLPAVQLDSCHFHLLLNLQISPGRELQEQLLACSTAFWSCFTLKRHFLHEVLTGMTIILAKLYVKNVNSTRNSHFSPSQNFHRKEKERRAGEKDLYKCVWIIKSMASLKEKMWVKEERDAKLDHMEHFKRYILRNVFCHISWRMH